jgi:thioredoxin 2
MIVKLDSEVEDVPEKIKISCLQCGATNAYPVGAGAKAVVCGRCKTPLPIPGTVLEPSPEQAMALIENAKLLLLLDFSSPTCMPCHMMRPVVESLAKRRAGDLMVIKIETDGNQELAAAFKIQAVPTFIVLKDGFERGRTSGAMNETDFALWVASKS